MSPLRIGTVLTLAAAAALVLAALGSADGPRVKPRTCKDVVVEFKPEGSGGATDIRAKRIKCSVARKVLRSCIEGELRRGWSGSYLDPRFLLRKGDKRIRYLPVGGGGCIPVERGPAMAKPKPPEGAGSSGPRRRP